MRERLLRNTRIPLRLRKKLGKITRVEAGRDFIVRLFENDYSGTTGSHLDDKTYLYGMHEPASIRFMRGTLAAQRAAGLSPVYWDVGTNTGAHLLAIASMADHAFGFEPWAPVRARAEANVASAALSHVEIIPCGLGATDGDLPFAPPVDGNHGTGSFYREDKKTQQTLKVCRGDTVAAERGMMPILIKIDTEGYEGSVLEGLQNTLRHARPVVVFEYSAMTKADLNGPHSLQSLFGDGYDFYCIKPSREYPRLENFRAGRRCENMVAWPKSSAAKISDALNAAFKR